ncbi:MAG TPA: Uma2 family endonuclease [Vicinamibacterales bacterium]|nr:Uma2 family endonuclease [Vicinamibacterales bacterium]
MKLTYDDFVLFPDDGKRQELIDGEHYVTPSPNLKHQAVCGNLHGRIWNYLQERQIGKVYSAPLDVVFSHLDVVEPDLLFVSEARRAVLTAKNVQGAPDLVVEVGSPSTRRRDEKLKHQLYERFSVAEYWVVDPDVDVVRVYPLQSRKYLGADELSLDLGDVLTTPLLPGLELKLSDIFAE